MPEMPIDHGLIANVWKPSDFVSQSKDLMRLIRLLLTLTVVTPPSYSQQQPSREIVAEGSARINVKPDLAFFTFTIVKNHSSEKQAINELNTGIEVLEKALNEIGFLNTAVKISDYSVLREFNDRTDKETYIATNTLKLEFQMNHKLIDAIYGQIQRAGIQDVNINFSSKLSDSLEKVTRTKVVRMAIEAAKANASTIASALDIKLGKVKLVQKASAGVLSNGIEINKFTPPKIVNDEEVKSAFDKFEIEEIELEDQITIIYTIANARNGRKSWQTICPELYCKFNTKSLYHQQSSLSSCLT